MGTVTFFKNGQMVSQREVSLGPLYPVVVLPTGGDKATISLRLPHTSLPRSTKVWQVQQPCAQDNPLNCVFDHLTLRRHYPAPMSVGEMSDKEDVRPWLVEQHLWGLGLPAETLSAEAGKIVKAVHRRLAQHTDSLDPIREVAEARAKMVSLLREEILCSAKTTARNNGAARISRIRDAESRSEKTAKSVSAGSFKVFLLITSSVMKLDPGVAEAALGTISDTIRSIDSGVLAPNHPDRPSHISEKDLDSVDTFLHSLVSSTDERLGQLAAESVLLLAERRGQAHHFFHAIETLDTTFVKCQAEWAGKLGEKLPIWPS